MCIVCACTATLKLLANRFFPKLLGKSTVPSVAYPGNPGKGSTLALEPMTADSQAYALRSYRQTAEVGDYKAVVSAHQNRKHWDFDGLSQESIIGALDPFNPELKEGGIYVARAVRILLFANNSVTICVWSWNIAHALLGFKADGLMG